MPRRMRRRLLTPNKKKVSITKNVPYDDDSEEEIEVSTPRGRLKGALKYALDPEVDETDFSVNNSAKRNSKRDTTLGSSSSSGDDTPSRKGRQLSPQRYIFKLFDRNVDLSQFEEDSPLYPICRAWIANQPKMNYKKFGRNRYKPPETTDDSVELPGPTGPSISRIPPLLPMQETRNKDNINLDYGDEELPSRESLLGEHSGRWLRVRRSWLDQATKVEARYEATQQLLNKINVNAL